MPTDKRQPNLIILAGPNGSGKSTFFDRNLAKWGLPFVNPDVIAKQIAPEDPANAALKAARVASEQRKQLLDSHRAFVTEGLRPDPHLIEEGRSRGFYVRVVFVCVGSPDLNTFRVLQRVSKGGHTVPLDAIPVRYKRSLESLPEAVKLADQVLLFDNSQRAQPHRLIARFDQGKLVRLRRFTPGWAERTFPDEFAAFRANRGR